MPRDSSSRPCVSCRIRLGSPCSLTAGWPSASFPNSAATAGWPRISRARSHQPTRSSMSRAIMLRVRRLARSGQDSCLKGKIQRKGLSYWPRELIALGRGGMGPFHEVTCQIPMLRHRSESLRGSHLGLGAERRCLRQKILHLRPPSARGRV